MTQQWGLIWFLWADGNAGWIISVDVGIESTSHVAPTNLE
jgi:hypothetical protein